MGLILQCDPRLAPGPGDPFLVTDDELLVCALSQGGERLLGRPEPSVIHRALSRLVIGAIEDEHGVPALPRLMRMAAAGQLDFATTVVGLVEAGSATHYRARVGCSGPPSAALLVIDEPVD